jgi:hypothetical protein
MFVSSILGRLIRDRQLIGMFHTLIGARKVRPHDENVIAISSSGYQQNQI